MKRLWFFQEPTGQFNEFQRSQLAVGWPLGEIIPEVNLENYMRRYLNDPVEQSQVGPEIPQVQGPETPMTKYLRRYLVDPKS